MKWFCGVGAAWLVAAAGAAVCWADDASSPLATKAAAAPRGEVVTSALQRERASATKHRIQELIAELGSPHYADRRAAANELRQIGAEAFDLLHAATDSSDLEVAASAHYLLRQITVRWVQGDDPPLVRRALRGYGNKPEERRLRTIEDLAKLPPHEGVVGLCRVARYDRSPLLARAAALAVIRPDERSVTSQPIDPETIDRELGDSMRTAAIWLRQFRAQLRDPAGAVVEWQQIIDEEAAQLEHHTDDTTEAIVLGLMWNLADVYRQLGDRPELMETLDRMVRVDADSPERTTVDLLLWLVEWESWDALDEFLAKYDTRLSRAKRPLYIAALARAKQGKSDLAENLADKAAILEPQADLESFMIAKELELRNRFEWSLREYRRVIDNQRLEAHEAILARISLAHMLHDYEHHQEAADVLEPLVKALQEDGDVGELYTQIRRYHIRQNELELPERQAVAAKFHHYRACQYRDEADWERERQHLEDAIRFDDTDADVVIQMYRLPEADAEWRAMVLKRIDDLCRLFQRQIDESPGHPSAYNQWAWLVSNTEGDYRQAIRYSHRSLELLGPTGGDGAAAAFLDTLGRCYYAAGDYENAVKYQRQAIERLDYMQVMHRQLALFEEALAAEQEKE